MGRQFTRGKVAIAAVVSVGVLGFGGYGLLDRWLDQTAKQEVEAKLSALTGLTTTCATGNATIFTKTVSLQNCTIANLPNFASPSLLTVEQMTFTLDRLDPRNAAIESLVLEQVLLNLDITPKLGLTLYQINLESLIKILKKQPQEGRPTFALKELRLENITLKLNLNPLSKEVNLGTITLNNLTQDNFAAELERALQREIIPTLSRLMEDVAGRANQLLEGLFR